MTTVRYAPPGSTTGKTVNRDLATLLDDVREHINPYEYSFDAVLQLPLYKGVTVEDGNAFSQKAHQKHTARTTTVASNPQNANFLAPLSQKKITLQGHTGDALKSKTVTYSSLHSKYTSLENTIREKLIETATPYEQYHARPLLARLEGNLLMVYCISYELACELSGVLKGFSDTVSEIVSKRKQQEDTRNRFFNATKPTTDLAGNNHHNKQSTATVYSAKHMSPSNRKAFTSKMRTNTDFSDLLDENIATQKAQTTCSTQQPGDWLHQSVIVPHWETTKQVETYVSASVEGIVADGVHITVKRGTHTWNVPTQHAHPVNSCSEVRLGGCVFHKQHTAGGADYKVFTIVGVRTPNNILDCGFAGEKHHRVELPAVLTVDTLRESLKQIGSDLDVQWDNRHSRFVFMSKNTARFTLWNTSSCLALFGFREGSTYESHYSETHKAYIIESAHPVEYDTELHLHTTTQLTLQNNPNTHLTTRIETELADIIPVRPQYKKDGKAFAYMSAYQQFPIRFLSSQHPQRGLLLFHEMGSGKSRTSIEMAQRDLEHRFWTQVTQQHHLENYTLTHWNVERPPIIIFSPTQEARDHYIDGEVSEWLSCWWSEQPDSSWCPVQHMYTSFGTRDLLAEILAHEKKVIAHLKKHFILPIVYTNNTRNLYKVVQIIRKGVVRKTFRVEDKKLICAFFQCKMDDKMLELHPQLDADAFYSRIFEDTFVVIDEMHNLCNSISNAALEQRPESGSGYGTFFYRCLMEAKNCRLVGLTGTPIQKDPLSLAPLFNLIGGKETVYNIQFTDALSSDIKNALFAQCRPFAETVWVDCKQSEGHNFAFSPWKRDDILHELNDVWIPKIQSQYKQNITIEHRDYERFEFGFKQTPLRKKGTNKAYVYDNLSFSHKYVKYDKIHNAYDFIRHIIGLVSYVSPPKITADTSNVVTANATANVYNEYPEYNIRTVYLTASQSHMSYIQSIVTRKKELNQRHAENEQRSGCNVNWNAVPTDVLDGKSGLLKLFFKGKDSLADVDHEHQYHQLLFKVHALFSEVQRHPALQHCLHIDKNLQSFSPKMYTIAHMLLENAQHKAVVYSEFIDGVGKYGMLHASPSRKKVFDENHVGLSGLGLFGYILESNGFVRFKVVVNHPLEVVHRKIWQVTGGAKRDVYLAIGGRRFRNTVLLTPGEIVSLCADVGVSLNADETQAIHTDINWGANDVKVSDFCRKGLMVQDFSPHFMSSLVRYRLALDHTCAQQMRAHHARGNRAHVFVEYSNRCVTNSTSKEGMQFAKRTILKLYNLKRDADLDTMNAFTPSTLGTLKALLQRERAPPTNPVKRLSRKSKRNTASHTQRRAPNKAGDPPPVGRGNAYAALIQTLFVSTSVTEGVEFKDVRTMHIMEPPNDYRQLEQMFGRVIRRGSHAGLRPSDRSVEIMLYVLSTLPTLRTVKQRSNGQMTKQLTTADELYWNKVIKRKYEISQEFYQLLKHVALDCRHNLALNSLSFQDKHLTCFEYPYQRNLQDWNDSEVPLYTPLENDLISQTKSSNVNAIDIQRIAEMIKINN